MSAQLRSRALQQGRAKALRRMKQPMTRVLDARTGWLDGVALQVLLRQEDRDE